MSGVSPAVKASVLRESGSKCFYCPAIVSFGSPTGRVGCFDHFIPKAAGGSNRYANIVLSCLDCNFRKGNRLPTQAERAKLAEIKSGGRTSAVILRAEGLLDPAVAKKPRSSHPSLEHLDKPGGWKRDRRPTAPKESMK